MSVERSLEAWEGMQRQGQDFADRFNSLAQGFTGLIHSHMNSSGFSWPNHQESKSFDVEILNQSTEKRDLGLLATDSSGINGVSAIFDFGNRLGQASAEFGACLNGVVQQFFRRLPLAFRQDENDGASLRVDSNYRNKDQFLDLKIEDAGSVGDLWKGCGTNRPSYGFAEPEGDPDESSEEESSGFHLKSPGYFSRPQGSINITSVYDSRTHGIESSVVAKGDLWRAEASHGSSTSGNESSPLFLIQLGPVLFIRDTTLLLPVHLSKQHLLWYGFDRKNGMHSLCPAVWSKHRRWLLMSMISLNPLACSKVIQMQETKRSVHALALFRGRILNRKIALNDKIEMTPEILQDEAGIHLSFMDLQFPNGQLTYVVGEGLTTSAFLPVFGGLLQAQGRYPGETRFSFSCKNKRGSRITSTVQWPSRSLSLGVVQALAWERTGLMVRPTVQFSICPTFGGSNPGLRAELIHSMKEKLNLICGYSCTAHPSAFASVALGRSKWNGHVGSSGIVVRVETPIGNVGRPSFSVQLNSGVEF